MECISNTASKQKCSTSAHKWCRHKAYEWYDNNGWIVGCNYIPASAINQLEMWQAETFDIACIDKELSWARRPWFQCNSCVPASFTVGA